MRADRHDRRRGTPSPAAPAAGRTGRSTCRAFAGKQVELLITVITDWGTLGLGTWVDDVKVTDGATTLGVDGLRDRRPAAGPSTDPPAGSDFADAQLDARAARSSRRAASSRTDDTVYTGSGSRASSAAAAAGVHEARPEAPGRASRTTRRRGNAVPGCSRAAAAAPRRGQGAKLIGKKRLRADSKRRARCACRAPATRAANCNGTREAARGKRRSGRKRSRSPPARRRPSPCGSRGPRCSSAGRASAREHLGHEQGPPAAPTRRAACDAAPKAAKAGRIRRPTGRAAGAAGGGLSVR